VRFAILVGVEKYDDVNIPPLTGPANDVEQMKKALETYAGFVDDNVFVLSTSDPAHLPTRTQILIALSKIKNFVPKNGLLLFMFSGHGVSKGNAAYLLPGDARQTDDPELLTETALPVELIRRKIAETGVKQAIVLIDACRNGLKTSKGEGDNPLTEPFKKELDFAELNKEVEASAVVYATAVGSRAWIDNDKHLGYFTEAMTDGIAGKADSKQGRITLSSLLDYVQSTVPKMVARDLGANTIQKPFFVLSGYKPSELVIATTNAPIATNPVTGTNPLNPPTIDPVHRPIPISATNLDFGSEFEKYSDDELALSRLGEAAFQQANYEWTVKFLERAKRVQKSKAWMSMYPYLAAAYLLGQNDETKFVATLDDMLKAMQVPNAYLSHSIPISFAIANLNKIRAVVPATDVKIIDTAIQHANQIAGNQTTSDLKPTALVCQFSGEANPNSKAYQKTESCIIPNLDRLDRQYRQGDFSCCGGGATSPTTSSDIPAGLEIRVYGGYYWSVGVPALDSDKFSISTYCGPGTLPTQGCYVRTLVVAHYK
jgi:hypothetical protein